MPKITGRRSESADAHLYLLMTMAFFGSAFACSKVVVGDVPHQVAAALRFGGGAVILVALLALWGGGSKGKELTSWREVVRAGSVGLVGVFAYNLFFFWGLSLAPSIDGSIIVPVLSPVLTTGALIVMGWEAASPARLCGLALGVVGAAAFFVGVGDTGSELSGSRLTGDFIFLLGAASWAAYSIASKKVLVGMNPLRATTYGTVAGALGLIILSIPSLPETEWSSLTGSTWMIIIYLAVGPTAAAYVFYYRGLRVVSPSTATIMMFTVPVFGVTCSVIFLDESFTGLQLVGAVVMIVGALLAVTQGRFRRSGNTSVPRPVKRTDDSESLQQS
ncbi:DMT family transporter [Streptomyces sp. NBC_01410]|uniref:DMT family transporter n=1 Tax=Streptomyces sp. NBC_01410 TaxID=2903856 RepID=UPI0032493C2C